MSLYLSPCFSDMNPHMRYNVYLILNTEFHIVVLWKHYIFFSFISGIIIQFHIFLLLFSSYKPLNTTSLHSFKFIASFTNCFTHTHAHTNAYTIMHMNICVCMYVYIFLNTTFSVYIMLCLYMFLRMIICYSKTNLHALHKGRLFISLFAFHNCL